MSLDRTIKKCEKLIEQKKEEQVLLKQMLDTLRGRKLIKCTCGKKHPISSIYLVSGMHYVYPSGCTGRDYYNQEDAEYLFMPCSDKENIILLKTMCSEDVKKQFLEKYRGAFKQSESPFKYYRKNYTLYKGKELDTRNLLFSRTFLDLEKFVDTKTTIQRVMR